MMKTGTICRGEKQQIIAAAIRPYITIFFLFPGMFLFSIAKSALLHIKRPASGISLLLPKFQDKSNIMRYFSVSFLHRTITFNAGESAEGVIFGRNSDRQHRVPPKPDSLVSALCMSTIYPPQMDAACRPDLPGGGNKMAQMMKQISPERRWEIATGCADMLPFAYEQVFVKIAPENRKEFDQATKEIWRQVGSKQGDIAKQLGCRVNSAGDVARTFQEISRIMLGPHLRGRIETETSDGATLITEECPMAANTARFGADARQTCTHCGSYSVAAIESLNRDYRVTSDRHMCMGDPSCRMIIEKTQR